MTQIHRQLVHLPMDSVSDIDLPEGHVITAIVHWNETSVVVYSRLEDEPVEITFHSEIDLDTPEDRLIAIQREINVAQLDEAIRHAQDAAWVKGGDEEAEEADASLPETEGPQE